VADRRRARLSCARKPSLSHGEESDGRATHQEARTAGDSGATPAATAATAGARASPADTGSSDRRRSAEALTHPSTLVNVSRDALR